LDKNEKHIVNRMTITFNNYALKKYRKQD
jgi:hypothetical protein